MLFCNLIKDFEYEVLSGNTDIFINNLIMDSRKAGIDDVFLCISGTVKDAHDYISDVVKKGVKAIVVEKDIDVSDLSGITVIKTKNNRYALACMSAAFFDYPAKKLKTIGITGTKGKTTTSYMVKAVLDKAGIKTGLIGTIETIIGDERIPAANTTPESFDVQRLFAKMVSNGCEAVVMEVSSQGLKMDRVAGFTFDYGIFTNLSPDHIGGNEHKDFEEYKECKAKLFKQCHTGIINIDDENSNYMIENATCKIETFSIDKESDLKAENIELYMEEGVLGISYDLITKESKTRIKIDVPGKFNVYNSLTAIAICKKFTSDMEIIKNILSDIKVKGRVEIVPVKKEYTVIIDYAHNAVSLKSILNSIREYSPKRIVTLFGCGGNRDKNRRFEMGEVSSRLSDFTIVTSDNPRFEKPEDIIEDIITGVKKADGEYIKIPDRKEAIKYALSNALEGDVIILAGKGHEDYQEIEGVKYPMDERVLIETVKKELNIG